MKTHYLDIDHDNKIPMYLKAAGRGTICGYQRYSTTLSKEKVTCKLCLREMKKKGLIK